MSFPNFTRPRSVISTRPGSGVRAREIAEQIEKREANDRRMDYWRHVSEDFTKGALVASQYEALGSERSFSTSMSKVANKKEQESRVEFMERSRDKLRKLFAEEEEALKTELEFLEHTSRAGRSRPMSAFPMTHTRFEQMRREAETIEAQREAKRKQEAEIKLYQLRKANCAPLKIAESQFRHMEARESWTEQLQEKELMRKEEELVDKQYEQLKELERLRAEEEEREEKKKRKEQQFALRDVLNGQVEAIKNREERVKALQMEERELMAKQRYFFEEQQKRKRAEEARKKEDLKLSLQHQCQAKLRRKAAEAREKLQEDKKLVESLLHQLEEEKEQKAEKQRIMKAEMERMKEYLSEQLILERKREREAENLFYEEARRLWEKREKEWALEDHARRRLMDSVVNSWGKQIEEKLKEKRAELERSRMEFEDAEKDSDRARSAGLAEIRKKREEAAAMVDAYEMQLNEKARKAAEEKRLAELEAMKENEVRKDEEAFISEELRAMQLEHRRMNTRTGGRNRANISTLFDPQ